MIGYIPKRYSERVVEIKKEITSELDTFVEWHQDFIEANDHLEETLAKHSHQLSSPEDIREAEDDREIATKNWNKENEKIKTLMKEWHDLASEKKAHEIEDTQRIREREDELYKTYKPYENTRNAKHELQVYIDKTRKEWFDVRKTLARAIEKEDDDPHKLIDKWYEEKFNSKLIDLRSKSPSRSRSKNPSHSPSKSPSRSRSKSNGGRNKKSRRKMSRKNKSKKSKGKRQ